MKTLLDKIQDIIELLIGTTTVDDVVVPREFDDPQGGTSPVRYSIGMMPDKRDVTNQGEDFPFCLIKPGDFVFSRDGRAQKVEVIFGLYEAGSKSDGLSMIDGFMTILADAPKQVFTNYKLIGDFSGNVLLEDHPYYKLTLIGEFRKAK
jgi:hypothetical protein